MKCKICELRKARRYCPGVGGDICSICCGNEREVTIDCPRSCPFLQEARVHEKYLPPDLKNRPYPDIDVTEKFLEQHPELVTWIGIGLGTASEAEPRVVDADVREALDAIARSYRTLTHGLVYESRPVNPFAAAIFDRLQRSIQEFKDGTGTIGKHLRDSVVLACLVLFLRLAVDHNNGRPKGRAFIDVIARQFHQEETAVPDASPRLIEL